MKIGRNGVSTIQQLTGIHIYLEYFDWYWLFGYLLRRLYFYYPWLIVFVLLQHLLYYSICFFLCL